MASQSERYQAEKQVKRFIDALEKFNSARAEMIYAYSIISNLGGATSTQDYWRNDADELVPRDYDESKFNLCLSSWDAVNAFIVNNNHEDNFFGLLR